MNTMKFTEARLELAILDLPKEENYFHHLVETIYLLPTGAESNSRMLPTGVTHE